jgi:hypothetical protein
MLQSVMTNHRDTAVFRISAQEPDNQVSELLREKIKTA